jgi:hypothetical protein
MTRLTSDLAMLIGLMALAATPPALLGLPAAVVAVLGFTGGVLWFVVWATLSSDNLTAYLRKWLSVLIDVVATFRKSMQVEHSVYCRCGHPNYYHRHYVGRCEAVDCECSSIYPERRK